MKAVVLGLCVLLGVSVIVNVMTLQRLSQQQPAKTLSPRSPSGSPTSDKPDLAEPAVTGDARIDMVLRELAQIRRDIADLKSAPAKNPVPAGTNPGGTGAKDPAVAEVLDEAERLNKFWGDLNKLAMARDQLDGDKYTQAVIDETAAFLGLVDPVKSAFAQIARAGFADYDRARKELTEASKAIDWKTDPKAAQEQYQVFNARYRETVAAANERIKGQLDMNQPRQKQFATRIETWMGYASGGWGGKRW